MITMARSLLCNTHHTIFYSYCCPYGGSHVLPGIFSGFALVFTLAVSGGCTFLRLSDAAPIDELFNNNPAGTIGAGIWFYEDVNAVGTEATTCVEYPEFFPTDTAFQFTRFFSTLSSFGGTALFVMLMIAACRDFSKSKYLMIVAAGFFAMSLICMLQLVSRGWALQKMSFFFFSETHRSDFSSVKILLASDLCKKASTCEMGGNAKLIIITSLLWMLAGVLTAKMKRKPWSNHRNGATTELPPNYPPEDRSTALTEADPEDDIVVSNSQQSTHNLT